MKYKNILVPYDGSNPSKNALSTALEYVDLGIAGKVTAFFAAPIPQFETQDFLIAEQISGSQPLTPKQTAEMQQNYIEFHRKKLAEDLGVIAEEAGDTLTIAVGQGKPSKAILEYARTHHIDLIVMGSRGLSAVAGVLGSVSYAVLRNAECPVMVER
ncbi:MAG: universal stress protein [Slackia sp.]|mgnify:FL=1